MKQRMLNGDLYLADDPELVRDRDRAQSPLERFNVTTQEQQEERTALLHELLGSMGDGWRR